MTKEELIQRLEEGLKIEETAIPLYASHINNTLFLSGFSEDDQSKIMRSLNKLKTDTERHAKILQDMLAKIKQEDKDVY